MDTVNWLLHREWGLPSSFVCPQSRIPVCPQFPTTYRAAERAQRLESELGRVCSKQYVPLEIPSNNFCLFCRSPYGLVTELVNWTRVGVLARAETPCPGQGVSFSYRIHVVSNNKTNAETGTTQALFNGQRMENPECKFTKQLLNPILAEMPNI